MLKRKRKIGKRKRGVVGALLWRVSLVGSVLEHLSPHLSSSWTEATLAEDTAVTILRIMLPLTERILHWLSLLGACEWLTFIIRLRKKNSIHSTIR